MPYSKVHEADGNSILPNSVKGEMWKLREELGTESLGFTVLALEPNEETMSHNHIDEEMEEIYYVVTGGVDVEFGDQRVSLGDQEAIHITPDEDRQIRNRDEFSKLVLVSAPV